MPHKKNSLNGQAELDLLDSICANSNLNEKTNKK